MVIKKFEELIAWQKSQQLAKDVYTIVSGNKDYSFTDQIKRAAVSISNNVAEGFERKTNKELINFLYIAKGSCAEVRSMIHLAKKLGYMNESYYESLIKKSEAMSKILSGLIKTL